MERDKSEGSNIPGDVVFTVRLTDLGQFLTIYSHDPVTLEALL